MVHFGVAILSNFINMFSEEKDPTNKIPEKPFYWGKSCWKISKLWQFISRQFVYVLLHLYHWIYVIIFLRCFCLNTPVGLYLHFILNPACVSSRVPDNISSKSLLVSLQSKVNKQINIINSNISQQILQGWIWAIVCDLHYFYSCMYTNIIILFYFS